MRPNFKVKFAFFPSCGSHEQYPWTHKFEMQTHWIVQNVLSKLTHSVIFNNVISHNNFLLYLYQLFNIFT